MSMQDFIEKIAQDIQKTGWTVAGMPQFEDVPSLSYTIGLTDFGLPEFIMVGVSLDSARPVLVELAKRYVELGIAAKHMSPIVGISDHPLMINDVTSETLRKNAAMLAVSYYGPQAFRLQQVVVPDKAGYFPWDAACDDDLVLGQPLLGRPNTIN